MVHCELRPVLLVIPGDVGETIGTYTHAPICFHSPSTGTVVRHPDQSFDRA